MAGDFAWVSSRWWSVVGRILGKRILLHAGENYSNHTGWGTSTAALDCPALLLDCLSSI